MQREPELFADLVPHTWLPHETLFSLCSRHHRLSGNRRPATTCRQLFGHPTQGSAHDFPSRIGHFSHRTSEQLGTAEQIIRSRTILPFYLPFATAPAAANAVACLAGSSIKSLKYQLGLLTSRFRANHPLKACRSCMLEDTKDSSIAYWHLEHQLPGVWVCTLHKEALVASDLKATGVQRFQWLLPAPSHLISPAAPSPDFDAVTALAKASIDLWAQPPNIHFSQDNFIAAYRGALRRRGLIGGEGNGRLDLRSIGAEYAAYVEPLRNIEELQALPASSAAAASEVARLVYEQRSGHHPLRHLALIGWLFGDLASFVRAGTRQERAPHSQEQKPQRRITAKHKSEVREQLIERVARGQSVSTASRNLGLDPATGMAWAAAAGIATEKRPSVIRGLTRQKLVSALKRGSDRCAAAQQAGISIDSVTRFLRTEVGLRERWKAARHANARRAARHSWGEARRLDPTAGMSKLRRMAPAAYAWLHRNDRDWLDSQPSPSCSMPNSSTKRLDWHSRDQRIAHSVSVIALDIATSTTKKVKLWQIYQRLPSLKAKLSKLERLPLTREALKRALAVSDQPPSPSLWSIVD